ncbi:hypothetical protein Tco_0708561 [Tanacetum coccineum]
MNWFTGGGSDDNPHSLPKASSAPASSLLADWNSYASTANNDSGSFVGSFDIESAVRSANDTVSGTFNVAEVLNWKKYSIDSSLTRLDLQGSRETVKMYHEFDTNTVLAFTPGDTL